MPHQFPAYPGFRRQREHFLEVAKAAAATLTESRYRLSGSFDGALSTDAALPGLPGAKRVLLAVSGTHGAEGHCGAGCRCCWLESFRGRSLPDDVAALMIRLFHRLMVQYGWTGLMAIVEAARHEFPDGLLCGDWASAWSNRILHEIVQTFLIEAPMIMCFDLHTGAGDNGHPTLPRIAQSAYPALEDARKVRLMPFVIECGTWPGAEVHAHLYEDHWLHLYGDPLDNVAVSERG